MARNKVLCALCVLVFAAAGALFGFGQGGKATAKASLVVRDPTTTTLLGSGSSGNPNYVNDQIQILRLPVVAQAAAQSAAKKLGRPVSEKAIESGLTVTKATDTSLIKVSYRDSNPALAQAVVNSAIEVYQATLQADQKRDSANQLSRIDASVRDLDRQIAGEGPRANVSTLVETRTQLLNRRAEIVIDAGATDVGIVASSPAPLPKKTGSGEVIRFAALGAIVGLLPAAVVAYLVALRRRRFDDRFVPEQIIERPLLSEIPDFASEHLKTHVPARDAPFSAAAEGYRFASSALSVLASDARSVAVVSASEGDGKSISAANLAWTAAAEGRRVLAVDADFEGRALTQLLLGSPLTDASGLLQLIDGRKSRREVLHQVHVNDKATLDLLPSGYGVSRAGDALSSPTGREVFRRLAEQYDLVIVDTPPLLQVAYAASIVTELDLALLVVPHHSAVPRTEELVKRLNYLGVEPVGYLYTKAPLRPGLGVHSQLVDDRPGTSPRAAAPDLEPGGQGRTVTPAR